MKKVANIILIAFIAAACTNSTKQGESTEQIAMENSQVLDGFFGEKISEEGLVEMPDFLAQMESTDSMNVKLKGTIEKTCKMKGCWMTVKTNEGNTMRVSFKDYGFFVPKEGMEGKEVIIEGMAKKKLTTVNELKHYAQDGGATKAELEAITEDSEELTFVANGVIIKGAGEEAQPTTQE